MANLSHSKLAIIKKLSIIDIQTQLAQFSNENSYESFNIIISRFIEANTSHLNYLRDEAYTFIQSSSNNYPNENIVLSFSGGKDSTVTADLVVRALSDPSLVHIFGDTTLEFPMTMEYVNRFKKK